MTTICIKDTGIIKKLICNGRTVGYDTRIDSVEAVSAGRWTGTANGEPFVIIGGRASGGAANEWFVQWAPGFGEVFVPVKSATAALNAIIRC
jgi:hypothetical protein